MKLKMIGDLKEFAIKNGYSPKLIKAFGCMLPCNWDDVIAAIEAKEPEKKIIALCARPWDEPMP